MFCPPFPPLHTHIHTLQVSNYTIPHLEKLLAWPELRIKPMVNQIELHPYAPYNDFDIIPTPHANHPRSSQ